MTGPTPPIWATAVPSVPDIHNQPPPKASWQGISATAIDGLRTELIGALVKLITELPTLALNLIRQLIAMIGTFEDVIFEIINAVLAWITGFPDLIATVITTVLTWITELPTLATTVINAIIGIITDIPTLITSLIDAAMNWISSAPDLIIQVVNTFLAWITGSSTLITTLINTAITWLTEIPSLVTTVINAFLNWIVSIPEAATAIITAIATWATELPAFVTSLIGALLDWVRDVPALVLGVINKVIEWFANDETGLIAVLIEAMLGWITTIPTLIATIITTGITWITSIPQIATDVINALLQMITEVPNLIGAVITAALSWVTAVPEMATAIINGVIAWLTDVPGLLTTLINGLLGLVTNVPTIITNLITTAVNWITADGSGNLASTIINGVLSWITAIPQLIENLVTSVLTWISSAPTLIADVVNSALQWVTDAPALIENLITAVLGWVESVPALAGAILEAVVTLISRAPAIAQSIVSAILTVIAAAPTLIFDVITAFLTWLDDITGLNLASWAGMLGGFFGTGSGFSGILGAFTNSLLGFGSNVHSAIPILGSGQVSGSAQNLLIDGLFGSTNAFASAAGWIVDMGTTITGAIGSALAAVTSGFQSLLGNVLHILPGETVSVSAQTRWDGLNTSGSAGGGSGLLSAPPLSANVNFYDANNNFLASTPLAAAGGAPGAPATPSSLGGHGLHRGVFSLSHETEEWVEAPAPRGLVHGAFGLGPDADWVPLAGSYVVPETINGVVPVTATIMLQISDEVDAGQVWFTKSSLNKMNLIRQELIKNLPADKQAIIDSTAGTSGASPTDIQARLAGLAAGSGHLDWNYAPDMRTINDALVNQINGWAGSNWGHPDAASALGAQKSTVVSVNTAINTLASAVAGLQADVAALTPPPRTNVTWTDEFNRVSGTSLGTGWSQTYTGAGPHLLATGDGANAKVDIAGSGDRYCMAKWNGAATTSNTDYQTLTQVFNTLPTYVSPTVYGYNDLLGRVNGTNDYILFRIKGNNTWGLYYVVGGVLFTIASGTLIYPAWAMTLVCGDKDAANPRIFTAQTPSENLYHGLEPGTGSLNGAAYRGMGFAEGLMDDGAGTLAVPGAVNSWTGRDTLVTL